MNHIGIEGTRVGARTTKSEGGHPGVPASTYYHQQPRKVIIILDRHPRTIMTGIPEDLMPQNTELHGRSPGSQVKDEATGHPPWTTIVGKGIGFTVSTITLFAILELTVPQFVPSRLASTELTVAVITGAVLFSCAGSILYFRNHKITIRLWIASAEAIALTAAMVVEVVVWQRPALGMDGSPLASLSLTQAEQEKVREDDLSGADRGGLSL